MKDSNRNLKFACISGPCKDCTKRHPACHDTCEDYSEYRKKIDSLNNKIREAEAIERYNLNTKRR